MRCIGITQMNITKEGCLACGSGWAKEVHRPLDVNKGSIGNVKSELLYFSIPPSQRHRPAIQKTSCTFNFTGTTVGVPTSGVLSGIASPGEALSVLPQTDNQGAADIPVLKQDIKLYGYALRPDTASTFLNPGPQPKGGHRLKRPRQSMYERDLAYPGTLEQPKKTVFKRFKMAI
jgi:hypothetical protein